MEDAKSSETMAPVNENEILTQKPTEYGRLSNDDWLGPEPMIDETQIDETIEADVVIIGAGIAGICAARSAAEEGASVVIIEKSAHFNCRSGQYCVIGGKINEYFGRPAVDPDVVADRIMRECRYRIKRPIISRWTHHAHEVFDWYISAMPDMYIAKTSGEKIPPEHKRFYMVPLSWPQPEEYDYREEEYPVYPNSLIFVPGHAPLIRRNLEICTQELGVKVYYGHFAEKLERDDGRFIGVLVRDSAGERYIRFLAKKGIVMTTGDNAGNPSIVKHFMPSVFENHIPLTPMRTKDVEGNLINTGDGLKMGAWAGAKVDQYHTINAHNMGIMFYGMGNTPFLFLNRHGKRFMNENVPGQQIENQLEMQPGNILHQIFDDNWREQLRFMPPNHGGICGYEAEESDTMGEVISEAEFQRGIQKGNIKRGETLEALLEQLDIDKAMALRSIERYNSLARKGHDDDFNKAAKRLFPIEKGPFYATTFGLSPMLSCIGGLESDEECHVFNEAGDVMPGLYVAGNVQGSIYAGEYPICVRGMSHSICMFYGYVAGKNAVNNV